jgi:hypothetical protein
MEKRLTMPLIPFRRRINVHVYGQGCATPPPTDNSGLKPSEDPFVMFRCTPSPLLPMHLLQYSASIAGQADSALPHRFIYYFPLLYYLPFSIAMRPSVAYQLLEKSANESARSRSATILVPGHLKDLGFHHPAEIPLALRKSQLIT